MRYPELASAASSTALAVGTCSLSAQSCFCLCQLLLTKDECSETGQLCICEEAAPLIPNIIASCLAAGVLRLSRRGPSGSCRRWAVIYVTSWGRSSASMPLSSASAIEY
jgi:hypothetical protein